MKTTDFFTRADSKKLNETLERTFGQRVKFESYTNEQLEDSRNRLRTQVYNFKQSASFNETVENEAFTKAQWMLDAINAELLQRETMAAEGHDPETFDGQVDVSWIGDDGEEAGGVLYYTAHVDHESGRVTVDPKSLQGEVTDEYANRNAKVDDYMIKHLLSDPDYSRDYIEAAQEDAEDQWASRDHDEGGETDDSYALASAGFGSDEDYGYNGHDESIQGEDMSQVRESATDKASAVVTAKTMVDRVSRWIEELSGMENDQLLSLGDTIRDEMGQQQAKAFLTAVAPAIQTALAALKTTRETMSNGVRTLTGDAQPEDMIGGEPTGTDMEAPAPEGGDFADPAAPDAMNADMEAPADDFAAAEPAAGGAEEAGRAKRESIEYSNRLLKTLAG
jgi:hypothetical protein